MANNNSTPHPLIQKGTHIIIDIFNIENNEILKFQSSITEILDKIVNKYHLNVVNKALHQFEPFGFTGVYVLSESHLSIHTFVEERKAAIDLYTCKTFNDTETIVDFIKSLFDNKCDINYTVIER
jgi:S-adenosylmethionine decarboxylase